MKALVYRQSGGDGSGWRFNPRLWLLLALFGLAPNLPSMFAAEAKPAPACFQVQFILATDLQRTNTPSLTTAKTDIQTRLKQVFKQRKFYYEVNPTQNATPWCLTLGKAERRQVSTRFEIEVTASAGPILAIGLYADGKSVSSVKKSVPKDSLVFGWDEADAAWYVVLTPK